MSEKTTSIQISQIVNYHVQNSLAKMVADELQEKLVDVDDSLSDLASYAGEEIPEEISQALDLIKKHVKKKSEMFQENMVKNREKIKELDKNNELK